MVPVPGGHFLFLKDHLTTPGNHLIAGTLTLSPCCLLLPSTKSRILCAFSLRNPCFRAFQAQNRHFCAREEWEMASGSVKVTFLQFTAQANVPQRCLEQGFVCSVICRKCDTGNQQHHLPSNTFTLAKRKPHLTPNTCAPARQQPHLAEILRWRRQSVQMGRQICVCLSSSPMWQQSEWAHLYK